MADTKKYLHTIDADGNKITHFILNPLTSPERTILGLGLTAADEGYITYDTTLDQGFFWNGSSWISLNSSVVWGGITGVLSNQTDLQNVLNAKFNNPTGTTLQYLRGDGSLATFPTIPAAQINSDWNAVAGVAQILNKPTIPAAQVNSDWNAVGGVAQILNKPTIPVVSPAALTKVDDTNVTLTLGGSPSNALLAATSLTLGWTGTLADSRIASAATWNAKQDAISLTTIGTTGAATFIGNTLNIPQYTDQFTGTVTSVSAGTGMSFSTITNAGSVAIDTTKVPFFNLGFSPGLTRWNGSSWVFDNSAYITGITSSDVTTALGYTPVTDARTITINGLAQDLTSNRTWNVGTVTSVGLSMPAAFNVGSSPITGAGTLAVTALGNASQYIRGDGVLANLPTTPVSGGASVNYYLNGSVSQGTIGGDPYFELSRTPILGLGTDFIRTNAQGNGIIARFITDANDPSLLAIPAGNFIFLNYFSASSSGGTPAFYISLSKYDGTTFTLIADNLANPETIDGGTTIDLYYTALAVPLTGLTITDRLVVEVYVITGGRDITLHTEGPHLSEMQTTFSTGITALNGSTDSVQFFQQGTSGTDFNISTSGSTHTFNLPVASATNTGKLDNDDWTIFNNKQAALNGTGIVKSTAGVISYLTDNTANWDTAYNDRISSLTTIGSSGAATLISNVLNIPNYTLSGLGGQPQLNGTGFVVASGTTISYDNSTYTPTLRTINTTAPLTGGGDLSADRTLSIPQANAVSDGYLSSLDWAIFNGKQDALSLTTIGSNGAASLTGSTLNIPNYTLSGLGGVPTTRTITINGTAQDLSLNRTWNVGDVLTTGSYANPSWITSLAWSKITGAPSFTGITSLNGLTGSTQTFVNDTNVTITSTGTTHTLGWTGTLADSRITSASTWNAKQNAVSLTTTGSSGSATFNPTTGALNIPVYGGTGGSGFGYTLLFGYNVTPLVANTTYYSGNFYGSQALPNSQMPRPSRWLIAPKDGFIVSLSIITQLQAASFASSGATLSIRIFSWDDLPTPTTYTVASVPIGGTTGWLGSPPARNEFVDLTLTSPIPITKGKKYSVLIVTSNWTVNPADVTQNFLLFVE